MSFQVDIKQFLHNRSKSFLFAKLLLLLNTVATLHAEDLTQNDVLILCTTKIYTAWFSLFNMKNSALSEYHVYSWIMLTCSIFSIGELDRIHSPSRVKYPVLNTFIILSFFGQKFVSLVRKKQLLY